MERLNIRLQRFHETFHAAAALPSWRGYGAVVLVVLIIKGVVIAAGMYAAHHRTLSQRDYADNFHHHRFIGRWEDPHDIRFFELWVASDAQWYNAIAEESYPTREQFITGASKHGPKLIAEHDPQLKYAFFPLWPLTIEATQTLIADVDAAGFVAANILSATALLVLYGFLCRRVGRQCAFWMIVLFVASPFGLFLHVPFSESLFLLLAVLTMVACERGSWFLTGLCIGLGVVTRPNGIAMCLIPMVFFAVESIRRPDWARGQFPRALWLLVAAIPLAIYLWHNAYKSGNAFVFAEVVNWWGYGKTSMFANFWHNTFEAAMEFKGLPWHGFHRSQMDFIVLALSSFVWLIGLRFIPLHYSMYSLAIIVIPLMTKGDLMSYSRYSLLAWPLFLVPVLMIRDTYRAWTLAALSSLLLLFQTFHAADFVNWHWVG